ncbi:MAG: VOC family protein [Calditrichaceae bacterium]
MAVKPIPEGYHTLTPYMIVNDVGGLIDFLKKAFMAEEIYSMPGPEDNIMHAEVKIGDSKVMIGSSSPEFKAMPGMLYFYVRDTDAVYKQAIQAGAVSLMEPADQFYGDRNAGVKDPQGNLWWIATHVEDVPQDEMQKRAEKWAAEKSKG